jgi:hypothetical protein
MISGSLFGSVFDAARRHGYRGYFWFGSLDPADQMPEMDRRTIAEKVNWLYNNIGAVRAVIDGLALDEVDTGLWPKPATTNPAFNLAVKARFNQQCAFHKSFTADAENNFFSAQMMVRREIRLRGDCFAQKLRAGEGATCPQMHFLPSWQCANGNTQLDQSQWRDGRRDNKFGRAIQFRFATTPDRKQFTDLDHNDVIHFHDPFLIGQRRGISELAPVVRKLFTIDDIERAESTGVLQRARVIYAVERKDADDEGPSLLPGAVEVETIDQPDGSKVVVQKIMARDGSEADLADLPAGRTLKVIESNKSSESAGWIKELLADVAYCTKYPPEYIFSLAGLTQGTLVRMAQQKVQRVFNTVRDFQIILQFIEEWWPFWLWQNIASGSFGGVRGGVPDEWWPYLVVRPRDMTVDMGREGRLYDERVKSGQMPVGLYVGMLYGEDEEDFDDQIIRDAYRRRRRNEEIAAELGEQPLPIDTIFRPPAGGAAPQPANDPAPDAADDTGDNPDGKPTNRLNGAAH